MRSPDRDRQLEPDRGHPGRRQGVALLALLALVVLAQWSTNTAANPIPAALTFVNAAPKVINYRIAVALAGVVGTVCFPWALLDNLFVFLGYYGAFLSAIGGIMVADYYLIRRRRLNVPDLYRVDGQFRYSGGFNWAGLAALGGRRRRRRLVAAVCGADRLPARLDPLCRADARGRPSRTIGRQRSTAASRIGSSPRRAGRAGRHCRRPSPWPRRPLTSRSSMLPARSVREAS